MVVKRKAAVCLLAIAVVTAGCSRPGADSELTPLRAHVAALEQRKTLLEDVNAIERLDGVYVGKQRVREYLYVLGGGRQGLAAGVLDEHLQVMPVISVAADGLTAK